MEHCLLPHRPRSLFAYYSWASYYTSFLQVNCGVSIAVAGYVNNIFDVVSGVWLFVIGYMIHKTCRYRWLLYWILPLYILGIGLMLHFRQPDQSIGYLVMCQVFMALSGGALIIVMQVAVLASSDHNNAASALAFLNVFGNIGAAVGGSISSAVWQSTFPQALAKYLPADVLPDLDTIYEDIETQLSYAKGTAARYAIEVSYGVAQRNMLIAGISIMAIAIVCAIIMRDLKLDRAQTKGVLF
jgi:small basic protein